MSGWIYSINSHILNTCVWKMRYISLCCVTPASFENVKEYGFLYSSCGATYMLNTPIEVPIFLKWVRSWIYKEEWRYYEKRKCVPPFVWESCIWMFFFFSHILLLTKDMSCNSMAHLDVLGELPTFSNQPGSIHTYMSENPECLTYMWDIWDFQTYIYVLNRVGLKHCQRHNGPRV